MAKRKIINTKLEILQCSMELFLEKGYTASYVTTIAKKLGISTGNLTFHFPTKEHLLAELVKELCVFQWQTMEKAATDGKSSLMAYLLELATIASVCDENPVAKDFYISAYTHSLPLKIIRESDTQKTKTVFSEYCKNWSETDFIIAENIVSGIEYSMLVTEDTDEVSLEKRIESSLDVIMKIYDVPFDVGSSLLQSVLSMDYREIGRNILNEFCIYVDEKNKAQLEKIAK